MLEKVLLSGFLLSDSVRNFKKNMKLGRFNEESMAKQEEALAKKEEEEKAAAEAIAVGNRCKVQVAGQPTKIGTVMFVGKLTLIFIPHLSDWSLLCAVCMTWFNHIHWIICDIDNIS